MTDQEVEFYLAFAEIVPFDQERLHAALEAASTEALFGWLKVPGILKIHADFIHQVISKRWRPRLG